MHTSTIIGARTVSQLEDNLKGLDLQLKKEQLEALSKLTEPTLDFPAAFLQRAGGVSSSGTTINGVTNPANPMVPKNDSDRH